LEDHSVVGNKLFARDERQVVAGLLRHGFVWVMCCFFEQFPGEFVGQIEKFVERFDSQFGIGGDESCFQQLFF